jgi:transcriptional regulator with XRE-family HTH domain
MHIGQRIRNVMKARGLTTAALAAACEVTPGAVSNWFSTGRIRKDNLATVARLLQVGVEDLISGAVGERDDIVPAPAALPPQAPLTGAEFDLLTAFRALPDDEQQDLVRDVMARAEHYNRVVERELLKRGIPFTGFLPASRAAETLPPAPTSERWLGPERRHHTVPVDIERRESLIRNETPNTGSQRGGGGRR